MDKPTTVQVGEWTEVVVRFNPATREYALTGCDENPVVAWGMLEYALSRIRRALAQSDMLEQMKNAPRVVLGSGVPS